MWPCHSTYLNKCFNEQPCQIILKSMRKCRCYGTDKLNLWHFYKLTFKCDIDLEPSRTDVSKCTSTPQGEQLRQIILKSIHKCRRNDPGKLNLWPFDLQMWPWPSTYLNKCFKWTAVPDNNHGITIPYSTKHIIMSTSIFVVPMKLYNTLGHHRWRLYKNSLPPSPVFGCPSSTNRISHDQAAVKKQLNWFRIVCSGAASFLACVNTVLVELNSVVIISDSQQSINGAFNHIYAIEIIYLYFQSLYI